MIWSGQYHKRSDAVLVDLKTTIVDLGPGYVHINNWL